MAGAGVCDDAAVRVLVREGPAAVRELAQMGARFDRGLDGSLSLTREGGHHRDRIAHAGGDATGEEIERALVTRVRDATGVDVIEHALLLDLTTTPTGRVTGLTLHVMGEGQRDGVGPSAPAPSCSPPAASARCTRPPRTRASRPATASRRRCGPVRSSATWSSCSSTRPSPGSGRARAGSSRWSARPSAARAPFLVDDGGARFMQGVHELADLAPRDVVAKAILRRMRETGAEHVWLDARHFGLEKWRVRFPTILSTLLSLGIDPVTELIPVVPACHYASGGVRTDLHGESSLPGLFVCGESACTGVHGANRLASNSLLEGLVFGHRIAETIVHAPSSRRPRPAPDVAARRPPAALLGEHARAELQHLMSREVGVLRDETGSADGGPAARRPWPPATAASPATEAWEATNLLTVAAASSRRPACARKPGARTGAMTTPTSTTSAGTVTWTPCSATDGVLHTTFPGARMTGMSTRARARSAAARRRRHCAPARLRRISVRQAM